MIHVSLLSCLSASPVDAGFLCDEDTMLRETVKGTLQEIIHWKGHSRMIVTDFIGRDKEGKNYNNIRAVT